MGAIPAPFPLPTNTNHPSFPSSLSDSLLDFLEENRAYVHTQINFHYGRHHEQQQQQQQQRQQHNEGRIEEETKDESVQRNYWLGAAAVLAQFEGTSVTL